MVNGLGADCVAWILTMVKAAYCSEGMANYSTKTCLGNDKQHTKASVECDVSLSVCS